MTEPSTVRRFLEESVSDVHEIRSISRLPGGSLNYVWRVEASTGPFVLKYAPPYVAMRPEIELSVSRIGFEARSLEMFSEDGTLVSLVSDSIRPPVLIGFYPCDAVVIMEDLGDLPDLEDVLFRSGYGPDVASIADRLGVFVAALHSETYRDASLAESFDNRDVQETRYEVQYAAVGPALKARGHTEWTHVDRMARFLGEKFLRSGSCLVMGDLWPASILIDANRIRLIDWEFSHFGHPVQDIAHLTAHLWIIDQSDVRMGRRRVARMFAESFLHSYWQALRAASPDQSAHLAEDDAFHVHLGCEILTRTVGAFPDAIHFPSTRHREEAIEAAICFIQGRSSDTAFSVS